MLDAAKACLLISPKDHPNGMAEVIAQAFEGIDGIEISQNGPLIV